MSDDWHTLTTPDEIPSPALLLYPERIEENIRRMIATTGSVDRLRPHVKTHKLAEVVQLQLKAGITKFKCATIAEAVGNLASAGQEAGITLPVLLDLDGGMGRTGIPLGQAAVTLYKLIDQLPGVEPAGLHLYDGHLHDSDPAERLAKWETMMEQLKSFRTDVETAGLPMPVVVGGGTPTFPFHARHTAHECSPGTTLLWDFGYAEKFADLEFQQAAVLLSRVVSKPGSDRVTLDLGHKGIAAENPHPRVKFIGLDDAEAVVHSEEHLTLQTDRAGEFRVGDLLYGIPRHICPTVALYDRAYIIRMGKLTAQWQVTARARKLTY